LPIEIVVKHAQGGDLHCAWYLIELLSLRLAGSSSEVALFGYAAKFFEDLLDLYDSGSDTPLDLVKAFKALHIIRPLGQPKREDIEIARLAARVNLGKRAGYSVHKMLVALEAAVFEGESAVAASAYKNAYWDADIGTRIRDLHLGELEAAAGMSSQTLLDTLVTQGGLVRKKSSKK
jgi:hypothetical protein